MAIVIVKIIWRAKDKEISTNSTGGIISEFQKKDVIDNESDSKSDNRYKIRKPVDRSVNKAKKIIAGYAKKDDKMKRIYNHIEDCPDDMIKALANNPEMENFVLGYIDGSTGVKGGITSKEKRQKYPLFNQWDKRWGYCEYGENNIGLSGCGPTALAMVIYSLTKNKNATPDKIAAYSMENGYYVNNTGTAWSLMTEGAGYYGLEAYEISLDEDVMKNHLNQGDMIICAMGPGDFTTLGHFIVIYGYDDNGFFINDPNCIARSKKTWDYETLRHQIKNLWTYSVV